MSAALKAKAKELAAVEAWNRRHHVGAAVELRRDDGQVVQTVTVGPAQLLGGHSAVIWLRDVVGCYRLSRVSASAT